MNKPSLLTKKVPCRASNRACQVYKATFSTGLAYAKAATRRARVLGPVELLTAGEAEEVKPAS
jgi:hypothetical protein